MELVNTGLIVTRLAAEFVGMPVPHFQQYYKRCGITPVRVGGLLLFNPQDLIPLRDKIDAQRRIQAMREAAEAQKSA
jgi:hypothetical protein